MLHIFVTEEDHKHTQRLSCPELHPHASCDFQVFVATQYAELAIDIAIPNPVLF